MEREPFRGKNSKGLFYCLLENYLLKGLKGEVGIAAKVPPPIPKPDGLAPKPPVLPPLPKEKPLNRDFISSLTIML